MKASTYFIFIILIGLFGLGVMHEQVHVEIFNSYGMNTTVNYFAFPNFETTGTGVCPNECKLANSINEAVGYHFMMFYFMIAIGIYLIIETGEKKKK